jgi:hypothetical protein
MLGIRGGNVQRDLRGEFAPEEDPAEWFDKTEQALTETIGFLRGEGVPHLLLAPSALPIPILATFFFLHPDPRPWTLRLLARWLWRGWVHGFGQEKGQTPVLRRAITSINPERLDRTKAPGEYAAVKALLDHVPGRQAPELPLRNFRTNVSNSRLILLALASLHPLGPDGRLVDLAAEFDHHGTDVVTEIVPGHRTDVAARALWPGPANAMSEMTDLPVLASHAIDEEAADLLRLGDDERFLERREKLIGQLLAAFLDSRTEPGSLVRPPLADLIEAGMPEEN